MTETRTLLVVGGGLAGAKAVEGARTSGFDGRIVLVGDEPTLPYERPPLSKAVLRGEANAETTRVHDQHFYAERAIDLLTGDAVQSLDLDARRARLGSGATLPYDELIIATGAAPRRLAVPG